MEGNQSEKFEDHTWRRSQNGWNSKEDVRWLLCSSKTRHRTWFRFQAKSWTKDRSSQAVCQRKKHQKEDRKLVWVPWPLDKRRRQWLRGRRIRMRFTKSLYPKMCREIIQPSKSSSSSTSSSSPSTSIHSSSSSPVSSTPFLSLESSNLSYLAPS